MFTSHQHDKKLMLVGRKCNHWEHIVHVSILHINLLLTDSKSIINTIFS